MKVFQQGFFTWNSFIGRNKAMIRQEFEFFHFFWLLFNGYKSVIWVQLEPFFSHLLMIRMKAFQQLFLTFHHFISRNKSVIRQEFKFLDFFSLFGSCMIRMQFVKSMSISFASSIYNCFSSVLGNGSLNFGFVFVVKAIECSLSPSNFISVFNRNRDVSGLNFGFVCVVKAIECSLSPSNFISVFNR